jgi:hypothetical protein
MEDRQTMRSLEESNFNPAAPLQTIKGTTQALRCGKSRVIELLKSGELERAKIGTSTRVTTRSINAFIERSLSPATPRGTAENRPAA